MAKPIEILLVDDSPSDVDLTLEALGRGKVNNCLAVAEDGVEALAYLRKEGKYKDAVRPSLVLLDLNMPRMDGREVLAHMKEDPNLKDIPVVILTSSRLEEDIVESYKLHANCYVSKPVDLKQLIKVVTSIEQFWFNIVELPTHQS